MENVHPNTQRTSVTPNGWYDVITLPTNECKWTFKQGDVAVPSSPRPGAASTDLIQVHSHSNLMQRTKIRVLIMLGSQHDPGSRLTTPTPADKTNQKLSHSRQASGTSHRF
ncbi:hypothetical protein ACET3Z_008602 [Daucus carota]